MHPADMNILIIDDEVLICEVLQTALRDDGFMTRTFQQAKKALYDFHNNHYDFVISDIQMPDMNGMDVLRQIKSSDPSMPVLLISAYSEHTPIAAQKLGALDILPKPIDMDRMIGIIKKTLHIQE